MAEDAPAPDVAVIGADGLAGEAIISALDDRAFAVGTLHAVDDDDSAGGRVAWRGRNLRVEALSGFDFGSVRLAVFALAPGVMKPRVSDALAAGCMVVDSSEATRADESVPLVVPEVNARDVDTSDRPLVAGPDPVTVQLAMALAPLEHAFGLERVDVMGCIAASSLGGRGVEELGRQTADLLNLREVVSEVMPVQSAFNLIPQVGGFDADGLTRLERIVGDETRRVLSRPDLPIAVTCVQAPVFFGHSLAVHLRLAEPAGAEAIRRSLEEATGVEVTDELSSGGYPTAVTDAAGADAVHVGRIRSATGDPRDVSLWLVADNVRRGVALNSVQIAEILVKHYL